METNSELKKLAKEIIEQNQYMTIASVDEFGYPWASPVAYVYDKKYNLYWVSVPESKHQKNIENNSKISLSIFDSHQRWGEGTGIQIEAFVTKVPSKDLLSVSKLYFTRNYPYKSSKRAFGEGLRKLLKRNIYSFYSATPTRIWVPDPEADIDSRIEVVLN